MYRAPAHLENHLKDTWGEVERLARMRGLERAFAMELFTVGRDVERALRTRLRGDVQRAEQGVRALRKSLREAPSKSQREAPSKSVRAADTPPPVGRASRKKP